VGQARRVGGLIPMAPLGHRTQWERLTLRGWGALAALVLLLVLNVAGSPPASAQGDPEPPPSCDVSFWDPGGSLECILGWVGSGIYGVTDAVFSAVGDLTDWMVDLLGQVVDKLGDVVDSLVGGFTLVWSTLGEVKDGITGKLDEVLDWLLSGLTDVKDGITGWLSDVWDRITDVWDSILALPGEIASAFGDLLQDLFVPDVTHRNMLRDWWDENGDTSPAGVLVAGALAPYNFVTTALDAMSGSCSMPTVSVAGSDFSYCGAIAAPVNGPITAVRPVLTGLIVAGIFFAFYRRLGDMVENG